MSAVRSAARAARSNANSDQIRREYIQYCSCSVVTIHGAYIVSFGVEYIVFLH